RELEYEWTAGHGTPSPSRRPDHGCGVPKVHPNSCSGPARPATISRRSCSSSSSTPASGSSSTSPSHPSATAPLIRPSCWFRRHQVRVLDRQVKVVRWPPADRLVLAALARRLPRPSWSALLVKPETVLRWHRELVRRKWASFAGRPRLGRPSITDPRNRLLL